MLIRTAPPFRLSRRTFLRGSAGIALALPALEIMRAAPARAQSLSPRRYVVTFAGVSLGRGAEGTTLPPATFGAGYALTRPLLALDTQGVKADVSVITNLRIGTDTGGGLPAGGRGRPWHSSSLGPLLSGRRALDPEDRFSPIGPTSDQLAADFLDDGTRFRSLEYKVQAAGYLDETSVKRVMSYRTGNQPNEPITSPRLAYESLFTGFIPDDPVGRELARRELERRRSVIDIVRSNAERLKARLGRADKQRLERHFDELRALETRLQGIEPAVESACRQIDGAGYAQDPGVQTSRDEEICRNFGNDSPECAERNGIGYAQEHERGRLLADLVHMAIVCDLTRVASVMLTHAQSHMNISSIVSSGVVTDVHECGHGTGSRADYEDTLNWHVDQWAYLVRKLRDTPDLDGNLLDSTALALAFEGGFGFDPESNDPGNNHSSESMGMLVAGAGLTAGQHIDGAGAHPAQGLLACLRTIGFAGDLGDFSTPLAGL